jgi:hypothetical protein
VSFVAITFCVASQGVFIVVVVYFVMTQSGNFWIHPRTVNANQYLCVHLTSRTRKNRDDITGNWALRITCEIQ